MKRVSCFVLAFMLALAGLVSEAHAVRPPQHVAPTPAPGPGGQRGDDDLPDKGGGITALGSARVIGPRAPARVTVQSTNVLGARWQRLVEFFFRVELRPVHIRFEKPSE